MSAKVEKALTANLDLIDFAGKLTGQLDANKKFELLQRSRDLSRLVEEAKAEVATLTEEQKDQLGLNYIEKLFKVLS